MEHPAAWTYIYHPIIKSVKRGPCSLSRDPNHGHALLHLTGRPTIHKILTVKGVGK
jgi:hypothetical protein